MVDMISRRPSSRYECSGNERTLLKEKDVWMPLMTRGCAVNCCHLITGQDFSEQLNDS